MELRSDFSAIQDDRSENPEYHDGELIYYTLNSEPTRLSVKVRARGNFRRDPDNCKFPPLFVSFNKDEIKNTLFNNQERLKLVTPCQNEEDVIEEYIIYKMYNQVTDISMKARLVKVLYLDTGRGKMVSHSYSFFLEERARVGERIDAREWTKLLTPFSLNSENFGRMSVFQYMIGNKDWFITTRHNIVIMQPNDTSLLPYAIPYDFDFSGFVNSDYSKIRGVPEDLLENRKIYKGNCYTASEFNEIFEFYRELRPLFESIIKNMKLTSKYGRRQNLRYIRLFYKVIESNKLIQRDFLSGCETKKDYNLFDE